MRFDADAYAATLAPSSLTVGGRVYEGRHLSAAEWIRALGLLDEARVKGSAVAWVRVAAFVFGAMFDPPRWQVWRRWPSRELLAMPPAVWQAALSTFFASSPMGSPETTTATTPPTTSDATPPAGADTSPDSSPPTGPTAGTVPATGPQVTG